MRFFQSFIFAGALLFAVQPIEAQNALQVAPNVSWQGITAPPALRKLLPTSAQILKCGVAAFGPRGATRWVVAWTNKSKKEERDIKISLFSGGRGGFRKWSERSIGNHYVDRSIKLYWLQPSTSTGPIVQIGNETKPTKSFFEGTGTLVVFPRGWKGQIIKQDFYPDRFGPHFWSYEFPFIDEKGFLCVKHTLEYRPGDEGGYMQDSVLRWNGTGWPDPQ